MNSLFPIRWLAAATLLLGLVGAELDHPAVTLADGGSLTVTASSASMVYGSSPPAVTATLSDPSGADVPTLAGVPDCSADATSTSDAGIYDTTCGPGTLAADGYTFDFVDGSLIVTTAPTYFTYIVTVVASRTVMSFSSRLVSGVNGDPVTGRVVTYRLQTGHSSRSCSGTTDTTGAALCILRRLPRSPKVRHLTVAFKGDPTGPGQDYSGRTVHETFTTS